MIQAQIQIQTNALPVSIETVLIEGQEQGAGGPHGRPPQSVVVPAGKELLEIRYTGLNLDDPQQVRFQYWMEGIRNQMDRRRPAPRRPIQQTAAGHLSLPSQRPQRRRSLEPGPPPGWRSLVLPAFWQTPSFRAAVAGALLAGIIALVYFISTQKLQRQLAGLRQQQALEKDRARIARDIHDQVGASLTQLSLLGEMVESDKEDPAEVAAHAGQISQTARETARALDEIVWTVNPSNDTLEGLINYMCKHAQEYLAVAGLRFRLEAPAQLPCRPDFPRSAPQCFSGRQGSGHQHRQARPRLRGLHPLAPGAGRALPWKSKTTAAAPPASPARPPNPETACATCAGRMEDIGGKFEIGPGAKGGTLVRLTAPLN